MFEKLYSWLMGVTSKPEEKGEYSAGYWQSKIRQKTIEICAGYRGRLLEVGCGEGLLLSGLRRANPSLELWGADPWERILARARELLAQSGTDGIRLSLTDGKSLPFEDTYFDNVVCVNVFLNIASLKDMADILREMARVCKPGGRLVMEFRNRMNLFVVLKFKLARYYDKTIRERDLPLSTYDKRDVASLLRELGFSPDRFHYLDFPIKPWAPIILCEATKK